MAINIKGRRYLNKDEVAATLDVCKRTVQAYERSGVIPGSVRLGCRKYWDEDELAAVFVR